MLGIGSMFSISRLDGPRGLPTVESNLCWQPYNHHRTSQALQAIVQSMLMIRTIDHQPNNILALLPNELMFVIFSFLPMALEHYG
jgi:hypothetical protein